MIQFKTTSESVGKKDENHENLTLLLHHEDADGYLPEDLASIFRSVEK